MSRSKVVAEVTGTVWKLLVTKGDQVGAEDVIMLVESMKMDIPVVGNRAGTVVEILVDEGDTVQDGQTVAVIDA